MTPTPEQVVERLIELFPAFEIEWDDGEGFGYDGDYSYRSVFLTFGPVSSTLLEAASDSTVRKFCDFVDHGVERGGDLENAISTCFLEHASRLGVASRIRRHLGAAAKAELR